MDILEQLPISSWQPSLELVQQKAITEALEQGKIIYLPQLSFALTAEEQALISPACLAPNRKNISYNPANGQISGHCGSEAIVAEQIKLMQRFASQSMQCVEALFPCYKTAIYQGRSSLRPVEAANRKASPKKDDTRLHVDAFPATPVGKNRILRLFTNINAENQPRVWQIGESFKQVADRFLPQTRQPFVCEPELLKLLKMTKTKRSRYDHYMLQIHDKMKRSADYQNNTPKITLELPAGATWLVYTDLVSHAALAGKGLLEQTFYLPYTAMQQPQLAPQQVLADMSQQRLF